MQIYDCVRVHNMNQVHITDKKNPKTCYSFLITLYKNLTLITVNLFTFVDGLNVASNCQRFIFLSIVLKYIFRVISYLT